MGDAFRTHLDMTSYAFFFSKETFASWRNADRSGSRQPLWYVAADQKRPYTDISKGDELFIVGIEGSKVHLGGRLIAAGPFVPRSEAVHLTGRSDFVSKPIICLADEESVDFMRPDLVVPSEAAAVLDLYTSAGVPLKAGSLRTGAPDPNLFRSCPSMSEQSAQVLRKLLGFGTDDAFVVEDSQRPEPLGDDDEEHRLCAIKTRRGQPQFRANLLEAYNRRCVVTACGVEPLLEAAHITAHAEATDYRVSNGLLLRADIHTLFDEHLIAIDERYTIRVSTSLRNTEYWTYNGRTLHRLPDKSADQPSQHALRQRLERLKP